MNRSFFLVREVLRKGRSRRGRGRRGGGVIRRGVTGELREHLNHLPHRGTLGAVLLNAQHGDEEHVCSLIPRHEAQPRVHHAGRLLSAPVGSGDLRPLDDVHPVPKVTHGPPPCQELQEHDPKAVDVALLVHPQGVGILCDKKRFFCYEIRSISDLETFLGTILMSLYVVLYFLGSFQRNE